MNAINPHLWWLGLLALVPILIHILIRQRLPVVRWAAMTFLLKALRKNRRKLLLETILLLVVRTAIVVAIVLVVVRPVAEAAWMWLGPGQQRAVSVIVLDDSASMAASDGVRTRFERAITRIEQYFSELPGGSEVAVVLAADPVKDLIRLPTRDIDYVRDSLAGLAPRDSAGAIPLALARAQERLAGVDTPNREIVVVTDGQAGDWRRQARELQSAFSSSTEAASVFLLTLPQTPAANVAIRDIRISGGPEALVPSLATTLWPTSIHVELEALHHDKPSEMTVELLVNGQKVARRNVSLSPDHVTVAEFTHRFSMRGEHAVTARCLHDLFERDDERSIVLPVAERIGVLMIDGRPAPEAFASATGYLQVALWPVLPDDPESMSPFDIRVVPISGLESVRISDYPLVILADVPAMPSAALGQLKRAVRSGSGLLIVAGEQVTGANLAAMFDDGGSGPLPVELAAPIDRPAESEPIGLTLRQPMVPALLAFEDPTLAEALSRAGWRTLRPVARVRGEGMQVWASFTAGGDALVANTYGAGKVIYFGAPADRRGGEFPLSPAFVPFLQQLAFHLLHGGEVFASPAGSALNWSGNMSDAVLVHPDGTSEPADGLLVEAAPGVERSFVLPAAERAGVYTLQGVADGATRRLRRAVYLPQAESDPLMLPADVMQAEMLPAGVQIIGPDEPMQAAVRSARARAELWPMGLLLLVALVATELVLVRLFAPRQVDAEALLQRAMSL